MIRLPPRATRTDNAFPTRRSSDLVGVEAELADAIEDLLAQRAGKRVAVAVAGQRAHEGRRVVALQHAGDVEQVLGAQDVVGGVRGRSEEHTSELQSLMRISYAVFCLKTKKHIILTIFVSEHKPMIPLTLVRYTP